MSYFTLILPYHFQYLMHTLSGFIYNNRKALLLFWLAAMIASAAFLSPLRIDGSSNETNMQDDPYFKAMAMMDSVFGKGPDLILKITPKNGSIKEVKSGLQELKDSLAFRNTSIVLESALNLGFYNDSTQIKDFLETHSKLPILKDLISHDTVSFLASIRFSSTEDIDIETLNGIDQGNYSGISEVKSFSFLQLEGEIKSLLQRDLYVLPAILVLFFIFFLLYAYRSWQSVVVCLVGIIPSVFFTIVCFSFFDAKVNLVTLLAIPIVVVLSIADIVHLITGFYSPKKVDKSTGEKIKYAFEVYLTPSFLTSLTTCLAFYSLALSESEHIQKLGWIAGTSILGSFVLTYLLIPSILPLLPKRVFNSSGVLKLSVHFSQFRLLYSVGLLVLFLASLSYIHSIEFKSDFETFFPKKSPMNANYKDINKSFTAQPTLNILVQTKGGEKKNIAIQKELKGFVDWCKMDSVIKQTTYSGSFDAQPTFGLIAIPQLQAPKGFKERYVSHDGSMQKIELRFANPENIKPFENRFRAHFSEKVVAYNISFASPYLVLEAVDQNTASSLIRSLLASTVLIIIVMLFLTRSLIKTLFSLIANLAPLCAIVLVIGVFDLKLNILTAITAVVCLGLIVDDTIHVLYRKVRLKANLQELGFGMLSTSILLTGGFLSLNFSHFVPTQTFGNISSIVFAVTLVSDLTLLPMLLDKYSKK